MHEARSARSVTGLKTALDIIGDCPHPFEPFFTLLHAHLGELG